MTSELVLLLQERSQLSGDDPFLRDLAVKAADRIESLDKQLEDNWNSYVANQSQAVLRIKKLEAALRDIIEWRDNHVDEIDSDVVMADIARRALEGK